MNRILSDWRRTAGMVAATALVSACADLPLETPSIDGTEPLQQRFDCRGDALGNISCDAGADAASLGLLGNISFGGQGTYVFLEASDPHAADGNNVVSALVTVQNLTSQTMGSTDNVTLSNPIRVVLHDISGASAYNWDGTATITQPHPQPFMAYGADEGVPLVTNEVSGDRRWHFQLDAPGGSFTFTVFVNADVAHENSIFRLTRQLYDENGISLNGVAASGSSLLAVGGSGTAYQSGDGGVNWSAAPSGSAAHFNSVTAHGGGWIVVGTGGAVHTFDGSTWSAAEPLGSTNNLFRVHSFGDRVIAAGTSSSLFRRTVDSGGNPVWTEICTGCAGNTGQFNAMWVHSPEWVFLGRGGSGESRVVRYNETTGEVVNQGMAGAAGTIRAIWGSGLDNMYAVGDGGMIRRSTDNGVTWTDVSHGITVGSSRFDAVFGTGPNDVWVLGALHSGNPLILHFNGTSWIRMLPRTATGAGLAAGVSLSPHHTVFVGGFAAAGAGGSRTFALLGLR